MAEPDEEARDYFLEALAIIENEPAPGRFFVPLAQREHLIALSDYYEALRKEEI